MERLVIKSQTDLTRAAAKSVKKGTNGTNDVVELENANKILTNEKKALESDIAAIESQYSNVAKAKLDRRLKSGADEQKLTKYQKQLDLTATKKDACEKAFNAKIEMIEDQKAGLDDQIELLVEAYREKLKAKTKIQEQDLDAKIAALESKRDAELQKFDITSAYFQPLVDACYETQPQIDVVYPPSYYKKKEQLDKLTRQINTNEMLVNSMIRHAWKSAQEPESQEEITRRRLREQARREDMEAQQMAETSQLEMEAKENAIKRAAYEKEAEARRERNKQKSKPVDKELPPHVMDEMKAYYSRLDSLPAELLPFDESDNSSQISN